MLCACQLTVILWGTEDERLWCVDLIKEYTARTKDRVQQSDKLFVTQRMGLAVRVSNATIMSQLKEILCTGSIGALGASPGRLPLCTLLPSGDSMKTIIESTHWTHTFITYGHYIRCLPIEAPVRILRQLPASKGWLWQGCPWKTHFIQGEICIKPGGYASLLKTLESQIWGRKEGKGTEKRLKWYRDVTA